MADPTLVIKILAETKGAKKGLDETASSVEKLQAGVGRLALPAAAALGAIALGAARASDAASNVEQSFGALESVFRENAAAAKVLARASASSVGLATADYAQLAAVLGSQLKGLGTAQEDLVPSTDQLIKLGADLAATYGGTTADAVAAVSSLMRGERDPIEKYGVSIKQADVNAQLAAKGLDKLTGSAKTQAEAQATLDLLLGKTADAQGAFIRETDTAAHSQQVANAQIENATAALGTALLPIIVVVTSALGELAGWIEQNSTLVTVIIGVVGLFAAAILAVNVALSAYNALQTIFAARTGLMTAAQWLLNAALAANPIGIVVLAIAALAAGLVLLWNNSETFRKIVTTAFDAVLSVITGVWDWITKNWPLLLAVLTGPFGIAVKLIIDNFDKIKAAAIAVVDFIKGLFKGLTDAAKAIGDTIGNLNPFKSAPVPSSGSVARGVAGPWTRSPGGARSASGRGGINVTVTSADPEEVVRALRRWSASNGGVPAFNRALTRGAS